jgi:imidazolonepropionase-like amidohydrolase
MSPALIEAATRAVHAVGGRVAVHTQHADGGRAAVAAGVDSIEHGMHLPDDVLDHMAGTALVPTASPSTHSPRRCNSHRSRPRPGPGSVSGTAAIPTWCAPPTKAGITVLAGTDLPPGSLTAEIRWLAASGMSPHDALGAGSWNARTWLGLQGIAHDAPADVLAFPADPRTDLAMLDHPERIILRGRIVR